MGNKKGGKHNLPSCCSKGDSSFEKHFTPQANSSFEKHFTPQANSSFLDTDEASSLTDEESEEMDNTFSTILSARRTSLDQNNTLVEPEEKVPACCMNKVRPIDRKILDASITSSPIPTRGGSYAASKSFANSFNDTFRSTGGGNYSVVGADRDSRLYNTSHYTRTHVPRASRNYHTYDNIQPQYYTTPKQTAYQSWSNDARASRQSQDIYNYNKQSTTLPRNVRMIPRSYRNPSVQEPYTFNYAQNPYVSSYKQASAPQASVPRRAYPQSPLSRLADPEMSSIRERRPTPIPTAQRRYPQTSTPYERPHSAVAPTGQSELPACCRPKTAEASVAPTGQSDLPACCRRKTGTSTGCSDNHCGKRSKPKEAEGCNDGTCSKQNLVSSNTQTCPAKSNVGCQSAEPQPDKCGGGCDQGDVEEPLDTLLEIRTPHRSPGSTNGMPFVLSINVSCADRSVVITPDKGYKAISSSSCSQN